MYTKLGISLSLLASNVALATQPVRRKHPLKLPDLDC